ncbi:hypothetical protein BH11PLA2_BH11PLA2_43980 [soil metagenome]
MKPDRPASDRMQYVLSGALDQLGNLLAEVRPMIGDKPERLYAEAEILLRVQRFRNDLINLQEMLR